MSTKERMKKILIGMTILVMLAVCASQVFAALLTNTEEQYMELKVASIDKTTNQVILEWWSHNLNFKGVEVRFNYDESKLKPSSVQGNSNVTDESSFEFAGDFASYMIYTVLQSNNGVYYCYMSLQAPYSDAGKYIEKGAAVDDYYVNSNVDGGVLMGRMSFKLSEGAELNEETFSLKSDTASPQSGVKVSRNYTDSYENASEPNPVFRFTVLNNDASLTDLGYSFFNYIIDENDGTKTMPTIADEDYIAVDLTAPDADSTDNVSKYTIKLEEYLENITLKTAVSNEGSTVTVKKQDENNTDPPDPWDTGQETKELALNPLGEGDTIIDIVVTAQDGTTHTYQLIIKRPYGTIKGQIEAPPMASLGIHIGNIRVYDSNKVDAESGIDWTLLTSAATDTATKTAQETALKTLHSDLTAIESIDKETNTDGTYEIYVIPGKYDVLIDKAGYLDKIYRYKEVNEGDEIDLGLDVLVAGEFNKDGIIEGTDAGQIITLYGEDNTSSKYSEFYYCDLNEDKIIERNRCCICL